MARPIKDGLDYFPIDLDIMDEDSVAYVDAKFGVKAFGLLVRLLMRIYRNGYYMMWSEREQYLFTKDVSVDINETKTIVSAYINEGFFDKRLFEQYGILTSRGIQKRYVKGCERRSKVVMISEYFLIDPSKDDLKLNNVTLTTINGNVNNSSGGINANITLTENTQSKVKENKEKESKENAHVREGGSPVDNFSERADGDSESDNLYPKGNPLPEDSGRQECNDPVSVELSETEILSDHDFKQFWDVYPKQVDMPAAYSAWRQVISDGEMPKDIVFAARKYCLRLKRDGEEKFMKKPGNFLSDGTYAEYLPTYKEDCPRCHGTGYYEVEEDGRMVMRECACKRKKVAS